MYFFILLGSTVGKAARKTLMKLTSGVACHLKYTAVSARNHTQTVITNLHFTIYKDGEKTLNFKLKKLNFHSINLEEDILISFHAINLSFFG